jgi:hypothetical protein
MAKPKNRPRIFVYHEPIIAYNVYRVEARTAQEALRAIREGARVDDVQTGDPAGTPLRLARIEELDE